MQRICRILGCFFFEVILTTDFSLMSTSIIQESFLFNLKAKQVQNLKKWLGPFWCKSSGDHLLFMQNRVPVALQHKQYRSPIYWLSQQATHYVFENINLPSKKKKVDLPLVLWNLIPYTECFGGKWWKIDYNKIPQPQT